MRRLMLSLCIPALVTGMAACETGGTSRSVQPPDTAKGAKAPDPTPAASPLRTQHSSKKESGPRTFPEWTKSAVIYEVNVRQYTKERTFKAFESHLPRLKEMGVDVLWFMPIHPIAKEKRIERLGSYYAIRDFTAVNPEFGTFEDFKSLVEKAHEMGFKVMMDWVANHTGWDHVWIQNKDWYTQDADGNIVHPPGTEWKDVADLNFGNADMRAAMIDAMKFWVTEAEIDGFRADYAGGVPTDFWEAARAELEKIKPLYMLAEDDKTPSLLNEAFDFNYGWELHAVMNDIAKGSKSARSIPPYFNKLQKLYPPGTYVLQFTSNHDENSWNGTEYERLGGAVKTMAALTFTVPGAPLIYSGQEAGLKKRLKFFDKDEITWKDLSMQKFYQDLIRLKKENPALWNGTAGGGIEFLDTGNPDVLAFQRVKEGNRVLTVMNLSAKPAAATVKAAGSSGSYALFPSGDVFELKAEQPFDLKPWDYKIFTGPGK